MEITGQLTSDILYNIQYILPHEIRRIIIQYLIQLLTYDHPTPPPKFLSIIESVIRTHLDIYTNIESVPYIIGSSNTKNNKSVYASCIIYRGSITFTKQTHERYPRVQYDIQGDRLISYGAIRMFFCGDCHCNPLLISKNNYHCRYCPKCKLSIDYWR